ncbi:MAG: alpha/beta hydrolase [Candidatus Marinimicrobia bacterium]|nr:alpha/beta hydrolase [Candidatus Neomarinimicrobiota bacterium]
MMRRKQKNIILIILSILIVSILGLKIYFEVDNILYEKWIGQMKESNEMNVQIESLFEHKTLKMNDYEIHYFMSGKENTDLILFLHPAFSDHRAFDQQIDFFSKKYRVITVDLIGHGLSRAKKSKDKIDASSEHIEKILKIEGFDNTHIVGVSMGSLIAQYFALKYPEKTKSLTSLGGYDINKENKEVEKAQRSSNLSLIFRAVFSMKSFKKKTAEITCNTEKGQALFYKTASLYERKSFMVMQGLQNVIKDRTNFKPQYQTLILTGEYDIELAKKMSKEWHTDLDNSEYFIIENAGHCANLDNPDLFNIKLETFLKGLNE